MDRWSACPGSIRLCQGLTSTSSAYAEEGTLAHTKASQWLITGMEPIFPNLEMRNAVHEYVLLCNSYTTDVAKEMGARCGIEEKFDLSSVYPGCFGTADFWVYWPWLKKLIVIDFKYGAGVFVPVINNLQAQYYALGVVLKYPSFVVHAIELAICQPRCMPDGETVRTWTISSLDLLCTFRLQLFDAAGKTKDPNAPLVPGDHCRWCPANQQRVCPAIDQQVQEHCQQVFSPVMPYDPQKLKRALDARPAIKAYLSALDEFAYAELEAGREIPGYKLVAKRPRRTWTDEEMVVNMLRASGHGDANIYERTLKSPAQMEGYLGKENGLLEAFIKKESSGHTIVEADDKRPAIRQGAEHVFKPIPKELL